MGEEDAMQYADEEHRGGGGRAIPTAEEKKWAEKVAAAATAGDAMNGAAARSLARTYLPPPDRFRLRFARKLTLGSSWLTRALRRHRLSSGRAKYRNNQAAPNPLLVTLYKANCSEWLRRVGPTRFYNLDEIAWRVVNPPREVIAPVGAPHTTRALGDIRHTFTVTFIVNAAGHKLRPIVLKKVKTEGGVAAEKRRYGKAGHFLPIIRGWSTGAAMVRIIKEVFAPSLHGEQGVLVMDTHSSHITPVVVTTLAKHNIIPIWVPPRGTGRYQPLDVSVMGVVRAKARRMWREHRDNIGDAGGDPFTKCDAIGHAIQAFREVGRGGR